MILHVKQQSLISKGFAALKYTALMLTLCLVGCMYPGMDSSVKLGAATEQVFTAQVADSERVLRNDGMSVEGIEGPRSQIILESLRQSTSGKSSVDKNIAIDLGK